MLQTQYTHFKTHTPVFNCSLLNSEASKHTVECALRGPRACISNKALVGKEANWY